MLGARVVFALAVEVGLDVVDERVRAPRRVGMHQHPRVFVGDEQVFVLVYDVDRRPDAQERVGRRAPLCGGLREFLGDVKREHVALGQQTAFLRALAVALDAPLAYVFVDERQRHSLVALGQELV